MAKTSEQLDALMALGNTAPIAETLGMKICELTPGYARVTAPFSRALMQAHGRIHGGVYGVLGDTAGYFAAAGLYDVDGVTVEFKLNLLEGVAEEGLIAEARVVRAGGAIALCDLEVRSDRGALVAKGLATYRFFTSSRSS
jgi:uncharacterized protein (TIGR00369 family)